VPAGVLCALAARCCNLLLEQVMAEHVQATLDKLRTADIVLTRYGNVRGRGSCVRAEDPRDACVPSSVFRLVKPIRAMYAACQQWRTGSYGGKHEVERWYDETGDEDGYVANGEFVVAMILCGFQYRFRSNPRALSGVSWVNPEFKAKCLWIPTS
jgi:hypothetical protein